MKTTSFPLKSKQHFLILAFLVLSRLGWTTTDCTQVSEIPLLECQTLLDLYNMTDGLNWTNKNGWNETNTPCSWYGVQCENGQVFQLNLSNNQLNGRLPTSLGKLSNLTQLSLAKNQLCGDIPDTLTSLANLNNQCYLSNNSLTTYSSSTNLSQFLEQKCPGWTTQTLSTTDDCLTPQSYTLTIATTGDGTVTEDDSINCGTNCSAEYLADSTITLFAQAAPHMTFMSWGGDCQDPDHLFEPMLTIQMTKDMTCTAFFEASDFPDHTITVTKEGTGNGTLVFSFSY